MVPVERIKAWSELGHTHGGTAAHGMAARRRLATPASDRLNYGLGKHKETHHVKPGLMVEAEAAWMRLPTVLADSAARIRSEHAFRRVQQGNGSNVKS